MSGTDGDPVALTHALRVSHRPPIWGPGWGDGEVMLWCECGWHCFAPTGHTLAYLNLVQEAHLDGSEMWGGTAVDSSLKEMLPDSKDLHGSWTYRDIRAPWLMPA